ncbi:MAG: hypothetical protein HY060_02975 [Proteobacteria bacterium]|nr:hypothetical protein [Pseudomonadota bacterium]
MSAPERPIAIYHEHPDWFRPLFAELDRRGTPDVRPDHALGRSDAVAIDPDVGHGPSNTVRT